MSDERMDIPFFANEAEEADWLFEHQDVLFDEFKKASAEKRLGLGTAAQRAREIQAEVKSSAVTIQVEAVDVAKARAIAAKRGIAYETYLAQLVHQELERAAALEAAPAA